MTEPKKLKDEYGNLIAYKGTGMEDGRVGKFDIVPKVFIYTQELSIDQAKALANWILEVCD